MKLWTKLKRAVAGAIRRDKPPALSQREVERDFAAYKSAYPEATHAQFYAAHAMRTLRAGKAHSTLGLRLYDKTSGIRLDANYFDAGRDRAKQYRKLLDIRPSSKIVDYGCGSLRLGIHFLRFLEPGNYMGLDVTRDFIDIGIEAVPNLIADKRPQLDAISEQSLRAATDFAADFVISNAVSYHVHPNEIDAYLANLATICLKPGSRLAFDAKSSAKPIQFRNRGWAYPMEFYVERLKPLSFVSQHRQSAMNEPRAGNVLIESSVLEFKRD
jgi:SAM-dependent methyltransferase